MRTSTPRGPLTCFVGALEKEMSKSAMSSSSEGGTETVGFRCCCFVVIAVLAATPADFLRASLLSLMATRLHGVADPDERPRVLLPVLAKPSIWKGARGLRAVVLDVGELLEKCLRD